MHEQIGYCPKKGHKNPSKLQKQVWRVSIYSFRFSETAYHRIVFYFVDIDLSFIKKIKPINYVTHKEKSFAIK